MSAVLEAPPAVAAPITRVDTGLGTTFERLGRQSLVVALVSGVGRPQRL